MSNSRHTLPDTIRGHHRIEILGSLSLSLSLFSLSLSLYNRFDDCAQASPSWAENEASSSYEAELESLIQARTGKKEALPDLVNVPNEKVSQRVAGVGGACMVDREGHVLRAGHERPTRLWLITPLGARMHHE